MAKSNYFGVTRDGRIDKFKVQLFIAGKPRFFGYYEDEKEAGLVAENARLYLQGFFPKPPPTSRQFDIVATTAEIESMRATLTEAKAPTYTHVPAGAESVSGELDRLFEEVLQQNSTLQHTIRRLNTAFKRHRKGTK